MTNEQILKKAIAKAKKNGYRFLNVIANGKDTLDDTIDGRLYYPLIFSHDFAQAFWGSQSEIHCTYSQDGMGGIGEPLTDWSYRLQQMVLEKEPLKYLEKFL